MLTGILILQRTKSVSQPYQFHNVFRFHTLNVGNLFKKNPEPLFVPCTPKGVIRLLELSGINLDGVNSVVLGRSDIVVRALKL
jgi:methylenetetrahydrofolate dehydrogenase (NADP+)/methenyltetrahydrofolate cyclohydrolase/formyltetrahydrofolate synthetase